MNDPLVEMLSCVTDVRREQAKRYSLANILAVLHLRFFVRGEVLQEMPSASGRAPPRRRKWVRSGTADGSSNIRTRPPYVNFRASRLEGGKIGSGERRFGR